MQGSKLFPLALACALLTSCATNRLDRQGDRIGRWRTTYDDAHRQRQALGHYRQNEPVGHWRYYTQAGQLEREERFRRGGTSCITYYHPNGRIWRRGGTRLADNGRTLHYYWTGDWLVYDTTGTLRQVDTYVLGKVVRSRPAVLPGSR